jgi:hypothetical protein
MAAWPLTGWGEGENRRRGEVKQWFKFQKIGALTMQHIKSYKDLRVYQAAIDAAMSIFELTKKFPVEERFSMVDQMRRSSRSVCSNIGEAWRTPLSRTFQE